MQHYLNLIHRTIVENWGEVALSDFHKENFTNADIAGEIEKLHILFESLGIVPGDRIGLAGKNCSRWAMAFLSVVTYGGVAVPILNDFTPENIAKLAGHSECRVLFTEKKICGQMNPEGVQGLLCAISLDNFGLLYAADEAAAAAVESAPKIFADRFPGGLQREDIDYRSDDLDSLAVINYTSGTTGSPKGIMLTSRAISSNVTFGHDGIPVRKGDNAVSMLPLAHMYGLTFEFLYKYSGGCHVYFLGKTPSPSVLMAAFAEVHPYQIITVPLVLEKIIKTKVMPVLEKGPVRLLAAIPGLNRILYNSIRNKVMEAFGGKVRDIIIGGAAISAPVEKILKRLRIPYTVGYGMTECAPILGYAPWKSFVAGSCGKIVDRMSIRVDSANPKREVGELQVKGDNVMTGYYKNPEATAEAFTPDGWLRTGDLGIIDGQGNIFIRGRSKCMILSANGQNIYPEEIESKLNALPYISESIVVARDKNLVAIVSVSVDKDALAAENRTIVDFLEDTRKQLNLQLPQYSQISRMELVDGDFVHTPKKSIKRCLYK